MLANILDYCNVLKVQMFVYNYILCTYQKESIHILQQTKHVYFPKTTF